MRDKSVFVTMQAILLSILYLGCAGLEHKAGSGGVKSLSEEPVSTLAAKPKKSTKVLLDIDNGTCTAEFEPDPEGAPIKGTLKITKNEGTGTNQCTVTPDERLAVTINGITPANFGPAQFVLPGSCRYCYVNSSGGMSCVVYNRTPCP